MNNENLTPEIRDYITRELNSLYEIYEEEVLNDCDFKIIVKLIEKFEAMAKFIGGIKYIERQDDRELGNIIRAK